MEVSWRKRSFNNQRNHNNRSGHRINYRPKRFNRDYGDRGVLRNKEKENDTARNVNNTDRPRIKSRYDMIQADDVKENTSESEEKIETNNSFKILRKDSSSSPSSNTSDDFEVDNDIFPRRYQKMTWDGKYKIEAHGRFKYVNRSHKESMQCPDKCCDIYMKEFRWLDDSEYVESEHLRTENRAGVFVYDSVSQKILLVQSSGHLWGPPKGGVHVGESLASAAKRELYEEAGIDISIDALNRTTPSRLKTNTFIYFMNIREQQVDIEKTSDNVHNDVSGHMWISIPCLVKLTRQGKITITKQCRMLICRFMNANCLDMHVN